VETFASIVGFIFAGFLFWLAYKLYDKDKIAGGGLVVVIGALILLCSFPWFQGWAKSFIASQITSKLTALGQQVNTVQETTTEMHKELENHQTQIDEHQKELDEVQAKIRTAETNVINDQSNLASQEKELSDVEYWVKHLYGNMTNETISLADTNHVLVALSSNGVQHLFVRLDQVPIAGSVQAYLRSGNNPIQEILYPYRGGFIKNIMEFNTIGYDANSTTFFLHYVADTRETNIYRQMPKLNEEIWLFPNDDWNVKPLP
jgi:hypothetical protein